MKNHSTIYTSPSNIALIKYMGKKGEGNIPTNASFSYTLDHLISGVQLTPTKSDEWAPLEGESWLPLMMSEEEQTRFLGFFQKLKEKFHLKGNYLVRSSNNFPKNSGIASSASSFSALTKATYHQSLKEGLKKKWSMEELAQLSQQGSGSSCRSFFKPWCLWDEKSIQEVSLPIEKLHHDLILLSSSEKEVSSSLAHQRVQTSPHFLERKERAHKRLSQLMSYLKQQNWKDNWSFIYRIIKEEFEDMHHLFETSQPRFSYKTPETKKVLQFLDEFWKEYQDGPLVTMDAGAHVHLLYRLDQKHIRDTIKGRLKNFVWFST